MPAGQSAMPMMVPEAGVGAFAGQGHNFCSFTCQEFSGACMNQAEGMKFDKGSGIPVPGRGVLSSHEIGSDLRQCSKDIYINTICV